MATAALAGLGYTVGRPSEADYLKHLRAAKILNGPSFSRRASPWVTNAGPVGGHALANVRATTKYRGVVVACGLEGLDFPATAAPFILRGASRLGGGGCESLNTNQRFELRDRTAWLTAHPCFRFWPN